MQVIPVIDLKGGVVVHARGGDRSAYAPIVTPLAEGSDPVDIVAGYLRLYPFETLYVADLDGIMRGVADLATLHRLSEAFPGLDIWLDNGAADAGVVAAQLQRLARVRLVIGTESLKDLGDFITIRDVVSKVSGRMPILSLDLHNGEILGADLMRAPQAWPDNVIAMTLDVVGANSGPRDNLIRHLRCKAGRPTRIVAAGGVRHKADLVCLAAAGADAALVATALHAGKLKADDLVEVAGLQAGSECS